MGGFGTAIETWRTRSGTFKLWLSSIICKGAAPRSGLCSFVNGILRLLLNVYDYAIEACFALLSSFTGYTLPVPCSGPLCLFSDPYQSNYVPCAQKYWARRKIPSDHGGGLSKGSHILFLWILSDFSPSKKAVRALTESPERCD